MTGYLLAFAALVAFMVAHGATPGPSAVESLPREVTAPTPEWPCIGCEPGHLLGTGQSVGVPETFTWGPAQGTPASFGSGSMTVTWVLSVSQGECTWFTCKEEAPCPATIGFTQGSVTISSGSVTVHWLIHGGGGVNHIETSGSTSQSATGLSLKSESDPLTCGFDRTLRIYLTNADGEEHTLGGIGARCTQCRDA